MSSSFRDRADRLVTTAMVLTAIAMVAISVKRGIGSDPPSAQAQSGGEPTYVTNWRVHAETGILRGRANAPVTVVEFMDFECPFCRRMDSVLTKVRQRFDTSVAVVFVHFPLPNHRFAIPAAKAAECGHAQGRFEELQTLLFAQQDSLGLKSWESFAAEAGVRDRKRFASCVADPAVPARILAGSEAGRAIGIRATPTILVNGWRFAIPPSQAELETAIADALSGRGKWGERIQLSGSP